MGHSVNLGLLEHPQFVAFVPQNELDVVKVCPGNISVLLHQRSCLCLQLAFERLKKRLIQKKSYLGLGVSEL